MPLPYSLPAPSHLQGALEIVQDGDQGSHGLGRGAFVPFHLFLLDAAAQILKLGLATEMAVLQLGLLREQLVALGGDGGQRRGGIYQIRSSRSVEFGGSSLTVSAFTILD